MAGAAARHSRCRTGVKSGAEGGPASVVGGGGSGTKAGSVSSLVWAEEGEVLA